MAQTHKCVTIRIENYESEATKLKKKAPFGFLNFSGKIRGLILSDEGHDSVARI